MYMLNYCGDFAKSVAIRRHCVCVYYLVLSLPYPRFYEGNDIYVVDTNILMAHYPRSDCMMFLQFYLAACLALVPTNAFGSQETSNISYNVTKLRSLLGSSSTKKYEVGMRLPNVSFDIPPSWAGNLPVSNRSDEPRHLYFWMFPATEKRGEDDLIFWMNGGPGCSSLSSTLGENGPVKFNSDTFEAEPVPQTWTKLANMVWLDQPSGVGFSEGEAKNQSMREVAQDFYGFLVNFYQAFPKVQGKRLWIGGESFAGKFIPFMADEVYRNEEQNKLLGIDLQGININEPLFAPNIITKELTAVEYGLQHAKLLNFTDAQIQQLEQIGVENGIRHFVRDNLHYPPKGHLEIPQALNVTFSPYSHMKALIQENNPCASPFYIINRRCSPDALGMNMTTEKSNPHNYFNDVPGVKEYIHAPPNRTWMQCSTAEAFHVMKYAGNQYPVPDVLSRVVEKSKHTVVQHGTYDMVVLYHGTSLALQNMTWNGRQGFENPPSNKLHSNGDVTVHYVSERNLTYFIVPRAGHMVPATSPEAAFHMAMYWLGRSSEEEE